jgi:hypothetical protein
MSEEIQAIADIDVSKIKFGKVKVLEKTGGKIIPVSYDGKKRFIFQLPEMRAPYGLSKWDKEGSVKYNLDLSFSGKETRNSIKKLYNFINDLDNLIVSKGFEESNDWFNKKHKSVDVVEALYTPIIKYSIDKKTKEKSDAYPPTIKINIPHKNGKQDIDVYDKNEQLIKIINDDTSINENIRTKGANITAIVQISSIWISGKGFGCSLRAIQMQVIPPARIQGYAIKHIPEDRIEDTEVNVDDDDEDEIEVEELATNIASTKVQDSDDDDDDGDDDDDDDDEVVETPKQTKKVVKNKK